MAKPKRHRCKQKDCRKLAVIGKPHCAQHSPDAVGRPIGTTLIATKGQELLAAIKKGNRPATARRVVGIDRVTIQRWINKGADADLLARNGTTLMPHEQEYRIFLQQYQQACVEMQRKLEERLSDLTDTMDAREALEVLSRMDREVWGRHETLTVRSGSDDDDVLRRWAETLGHVIRKVLDAAHLDDDQVKAAEAALAEALAEVTADEVDDIE